MLRDFSALAQMSVLVIVIVIVNIQDFFFSYPQPGLPEGVLTY